MNSECAACATALAWQLTIALGGQAPPTYRLYYTCPGCGLWVGMEVPGLTAVRIKTKRRKTH